MAKRTEERKKKDMNFFIGWMINLVVFMLILLYSVKHNHLVGAVMGVFVMLFSFIMCLYYLGIIERERMKVKNGKKNKSN
jgi:uncharacterized Tic20 family protein